MNTSAIPYWKLSSLSDDLIIDEETSFWAKELLSRAFTVREHAAAFLSQYFVGSSILFTLKDSDERLISTGSNFEFGAGYGKYDNYAIHAEVSSLARAISDYGPGINIDMIAVYAASEEPICCGNCLGTLATYVNSDTLIVACNLKGEATLLQFENALPTVLPEIDHSSLSSSERELLTEAHKAADHSDHAISKSVDGLRGCAIRSLDGRIFRGVHEDSAAFYPISAIESALSGLRANGGESAVALAFVSESAYISGNDRQKIYERADEWGLLDSFQVMIEARKSNRLFRCSPADLLPHSFSMKSLGLRE